MKWIFFLDKNRQTKSVADLGGKGASLARLAGSGFNIPASACVITAAYHEFISANKIHEKILLELNRKKFTDMRWEEIWDASLRIRNFFLHATIPESIANQVSHLIDRKFSKKLLAVRSSAPDEDTGHTSFAGLHESYLNIYGSEQILEHIKKVWASLWSDRALLYRQELGLDVQSSAMAVVIQEMIFGDKSGIVFSQHPENKSKMIIESVYGLNQGLVDGEIEPDRWILSRKDAANGSHTPPSTGRQAVYKGSDGLYRQKLIGTDASLPPLEQKNIEDIRHLALELEEYFGCPQDIEWTMDRNSLFILQSRPVTTIADGEQKDERAWYLSLHRSFDNLLKLQLEIEEKYLPAMDAEAKRLADITLPHLSNAELAIEIEKRVAIKDKWVKIYWAEFIPFAHGMRLFGEIYNDIMKPVDPYEFVSLLSGSNMLSTERNIMLADCAKMLFTDPQLKSQVKNGDIANISNSIFLEKLHKIKERFGDLFEQNGSRIGSAETGNMLLGLIYEYSKKPLEKPSVLQSEITDSDFLAKAAEYKLPFSGSDILELGRASYRLRDDDNIYLGKIEQQLNAAITEGRKRIRKKGKNLSNTDDVTAIEKILKGKNISTSTWEKQKMLNISHRETRIKARQLTGQPASKGIARGPGRLVESAQDMTDFKQGEVLVVDAIDPNMTFLAPLAAGIVERRGGMLIHGAIIAREYGIPCVTGVPEAMQLLKNGEIITVDGYLGIVTLGESLDEGRFH